MDSFELAYDDRKALVSRHPPLDRAPWVRLDAASRRLNLGCGRDVRDGFVNCDLAPTDPRVRHADLLKTLPFDPDSFDYAMLFHVIEHVPRWTSDGWAWPRLFRELHRVVRDGGMIEFRYPDIRGHPDGPFGHFDHVEALTSYVFRQFARENGEDRGYHVDAPYLWDVVAVGSVRGVVAADRLRIGRAGLTLHLSRRLGPLGRVLALRRCEEAVVLRVRKRGGR